ncbi:MAG: winged helix-turn-helix domain-containing protein [Gemmatimonadaceae bacterium]
MAKRTGTARAMKPSPLPGPTHEPASIREAQATRDATPAELDRLIHERIRLGIVSALAVNDSLSFNELKSLMGTTDGNLSVHARKLEDAGYVSCRKSFEGRMPKTDYALTPAGRRALERYLEHMEAIIKVTREGRH